MSPPLSQSEEIFLRLLDESAARLAAPESAGIAIPDDDLHREIIVPLLPAMLGDQSIRQHWSEQAATGFPARLARHFENGDPAPLWLPGDFEIHVTASYSAGADARALADTLLSEDSLRDMSAALMNQLLEVLWPSLAPAPIAAPAVPEPAREIPPAEISGTEIPAPEIAVPVAATAAAEILEPISVAVSEPGISPAQQVEFAVEIQPLQPQSRALIRARCGKLAASVVRRGLIATGTRDVSAAILARRILNHAARFQRGRSRRSAGSPKS